MSHGLSLLLCLSLVTPDASQPSTPTPTTPAPTLSAAKVIEALVAAASLAAQTPNVRQPFSGAVDQSAGGPLLNYLAGRVVDREAYKKLVELMLVRTDAQVGSTPTSGGSTSLGMKGLVPAVLGFAVEHGAITREINKTVATFRFNPLGLTKALQGEGLLDIYQDYSRNDAVNFASRFSAAASFDTSRGDSPGTLLADEKQLSAWSINILVLNSRDPRAKDYAGQWRAVAEGGRAYIDARAALDKALTAWPAFTQWHTALVERVRREVDEPWQANHNRRAATAKMKAILEEELSRLPLDTPDQSVVAAMATYVQQLTAVVKAGNDVYAYAREGALGTFDWTTTRTASLPDLYTLTGVYQASFLGSRKDDFTANVAFSFYRHTPAGADRRYKSFAATAEWDRPLGTFLDIPFIFTAGGRYEFIPKDIVASTGSGAGAPAGTAVAPKGHLVVGQAKLTIPLKTGMRIPLAVTFANRSELIKEKIVRANFGLTFDLDAFVAAAKAR